MFAKKIIKALNCVFMMAALGGASSLAAADTLRVAINTSSFGSKGWIDLMFNASSSLAPLATANLSNFVGFNASSVPELNGEITGSLLNGYVMSNRPGTTELFHAVNFGRTVSFDIDFDGAIGSPINRSLSTFSVALYGADQSTLLGGGDAASGSLLQLYWLPSTRSAVAGTVSTRVFDDVASLTLASRVSPVPEPSSWLMLSAGLSFIALVRRRKNVATVAS